MNTRVLLLGCLLALSVQAQESKRELWKWKDANGVTQYSDRPVPGATRVEMYTSAPSSAATPAARPATPAAQGQPAAGVQYQSLEIWQPESEQTFFGANTTVDVRLRSEPAVASDHELRLFLDGKLVAAGANGNSYTLSNLERGAHSLEALIVDQEGTVQVRSQPVVFHVMQPTTIEPRAVGPALKPQPPPRPQPKPNSPK